MAEGMLAHRFHSPAPALPIPAAIPAGQTEPRRELASEDSCGEGGRWRRRPRSLPGASGLSSQRRQQWDEKPGEHPRVLVSSPSRDPSKSFSIIKQARPKNSTEIYYMWQDNLGGEQGTKRPLCPSLPPHPPTARWARGGCRVLGAGVRRWVAGMTSKATGLGEASFPGKGSLAAFYVVVAFGRARQPRLGGSRAAARKGSIWAPRCFSSAPGTGGRHPKISRWHGRPPSPVVQTPPWMAALE